MQSSGITENCFLCDLCDFGVTGLPPDAINVLDVRIKLFSAWEPCVHEHCSQVILMLLKLWYIENIFSERPQILDPFVDGCIE